MLLTTRSRSLRSHPFETALPGGKLDPDDVNFVGAAVSRFFRIGIPYTNTIDEFCLCKVSGSE